MSVGKRVLDPEIERNQSHEVFHFVFTDAGCFQNGSSVLGCVIKDNTKEVVVVATNKLESSVSPEVAEALALRWASNLPRI